MPTETYTVCVPDDVFPGDVFTVRVAEESYEVTVPMGCEPGSSIDVSLPTAPSDCAVEIPTGFFPGDELLVEIPGGRTIAVVLTDDCLPGMMLQLDLSEDETTARPMYSSTDVLTDNSFYGMLKNKPTVHSSMTDPTGSHSNALESMEVNVEAGMSPADDEWDDDLDYDDSYLIQRSDGSYSEGYVQYFDRSCGLYHALIVGAGFKYVSREQIESNSVHY